MKKLALCLLLSLGSIGSSFADPATPIGPSVIWTLVNDQQMTQIVSSCQNSQYNYKYGCLLPASKVKGWSLNLKDLDPSSNYAIFWHPKNNFDMDKGFNLLLIPQKPDALQSGYVGTR